MEYLGQCQCSQVTLALNLPSPLDSYQPRACDCDFCIERHIVYLSNPAAHLTISPKRRLKALKQGSEQAIFWSCRQCHDVVAVTFDFEDSTKGAVNAMLLTEKGSLPEAISASPKVLSAEEKRQRWQELWLEVSFD